MRRPSSRPRPETEVIRTPRWCLEYRHYHRTVLNARQEKDGDQLTHRGKRDHCFPQLTIPRLHFSDQTARSRGTDVALSGESHPRAPSKGMRDAHGAYKSQDGNNERKDQFFEPILNSHENQFLIPPEIGKRQIRGPIKNE